MEGRGKEKNRENNKKALYYSIAKITITNNKTIGRIRFP